MRQGGDADDVGRVAAARAFRVIGVNRAAGDGRDRVLDKAGFIDGVGVNGHLHIELVGNAQAGVDGGRSRAPILMQFQTAGARANLFRERLGGAGVAFPQEPEIHRPRVGSLEHSRQIPGARACTWWHWFRSPARCRRRSCVVMPFESAS